MSAAGTLLFFTLFQSYQQDVPTGTFLVSLLPPFLYLVPLLRSGTPVWQLCCLLLAAELLNGRPDAERRDEINQF